jgi:S-adenosylmethionine:tRNA ribosyltransferase-isomerase
MTGPNQAESSADSVDQYEYELPRELIAQSPLTRRDDARLLVADRATQQILHRHVRDLPELLRAGDLLVLNDSRVIPAQLVGLRDLSRGRWHGLFLEVDANGIWKVLAKTRGKIQPGETVSLQDRAGASRLKLKLLAKLSEGAWAAKPESSLPILDILDMVGRVPLPHYIRSGEMEESDVKSYQTVFATKPGSIAAPTAGLHFTKMLFDRLIAAKIAISRITLHVGVGTFRPIAVQQLSEHRMHQEWGQIDERAVQQIVECRNQGGRVIAVGTTSVRVLETAGQQPVLQSWSGLTDLFIRPPHTFQVVDGLLTNFHLPRSTLLVLVRTFGGDQFMQSVYQSAIDEKYRFFSYGDAMIIL